MPFFKPSVLTPEQIERLDRTLAKGRKRFILLTGVLRWGMPTFVLFTMWQWHDDFGWHLPPASKAWLSILLGLLLWSAAGCFFGALTWKQLVATRRMQTDRQDQR